MQRIISLLMAGMLLMRITGFAQTASGTWSLTTDGTASIVGNVSAGSVIPPSTNITGFAGASFGSGSPAGLKLGATGPTNWPADGSTTTANAAFTGLSNGTTRYVQFTISPTFGNTLTVTSITVPLTLNVTSSTMNASLAYSTDGTNFTTFNSNGLTGNVLTFPSANNFTASPSLTVGSSGAVTVRVILWRKTNSTASSISITVGTVVLSGTTSPVLSPTISLSTHGTLSFGPTLVGNSSASQSFLVSGTNLTNSITITPPTGFEIRTGTNSFSTSPIILPQSGGAVASTSIDVRFTPLNAAPYTGNIPCTSSGASQEDVAVSGAVQVDYYSKATGDLDQLSSWTTDPGGIGGTAPDDFATAGQYFHIVNNPATTIGDDWAVTGALSKIIVGDGTNPINFTVPAAYTFSSPAMEVLAGGAFILQNKPSLSTFGTLTVNNGGTYQHDCDGGVQLNGTFMAGSTIKVTGVTTGNLWLPTSCGNVIWNCPSQTAGGKMYNYDGTLTLNGDLTVLTTGSGYIAVNTGSSSRTLNISGNLTVTGGSFRLLGASTGTGTTHTYVAGTITVRDTGVINISSSTNASPSTVTLHAQGNFLHTEGTVTRSALAGTVRLTFDGSSEQQFVTKGMYNAIDVTINNAAGVRMVGGNPANPTISGNLTVTTGILNLNGFTLSFAGKTLTNNSIIDGSTSNSVLRFNGSVGQTCTGTGNMVSAINEIQLNNSSTGVTLGADLKVSGALALHQGLLFTGNYKLLLRDSASISGTPSSTAMIVTGAGGTVQKVLTSALPHSFTFPVGDTTGTAAYTPVSYTLTSGSFIADTIDVRVVRAKHPANTSTTDYLNRYWVLTSTGVAAPLYSANFTYVPADVSGTEANLVGGLFDGLVWKGVSATNATSHSFGKSGLNTFGNFSAGEAGMMGSGVIAVKAVPEGLLNTTTGFLNLSDTVTIALADTIHGSHAVVESVRALLDSASLTARATFTDAPTGSYYLLFRHRNSIETWSGQPIELTAGASMDYNFTAAQSRSYGGNLKLAGSLWCIYSGDVNQDGIVDFSDLLAVDNDQYNFMGGYLATDLTGDLFVDFTDLSICDNNQYNFISVISPATGAKIAPSTVKPLPRNIKRLPD